MGFPWIRSFVAVWVMVFAMAVPAAPQVQVMAFLLKVEGAQKSTACTATLVRDADDRCRLLTNAHCFDSSNPTITLQSPKTNQSVTSFYGRLFPEASDRLATRTEILKIDPAVDLAELEIPRIVRRYCSRVGKLLVDDPTRTLVNEGRESARFMSIGYHQGQVRSAYSRDLPWPDFRPSDYAWNPSNAPATYARTSLPGLDRLYRLWFLQMVGGMSGGPTLDANFRLVGINRRYVPFQEITEVIPLSDVLSFLGRAGDAAVLRSVLGGHNPSVRDENHQIVNGGENSGANGGENSGANGGENSGANGGENSGANGEDGQNEGLSSLREPAEGIVVNGRRILAIDDQQVDGLSDYRKYISPQATILYQDSIEFLGLRAQLPERLVGNWRANAWGRIIAREKILVNQNGEWHVDSQYQIPEFRLEVIEQQSGFSIALTRGGRFNIRGGMAMLRDAPTISYRGFVGQTTSDGAEFQLTNPEGAILKCINQHFLKLICSGDREELSLSRSLKHGGYLQFRHAILLSDEAILYRYGILGDASPLD